MSSLAGHLRADFGSSGRVCWAALLACSPASCHTDGTWTPRDTRHILPGWLGMGGGGHGGWSWTSLPAVRPSAGHHHAEPDLLPVDALVLARSQLTLASFRRPNERDVLGAGASEIICVASGCSFWFWRVVLGVFHWLHSQHRWPWRKTGAGRWRLRHSPQSLRLLEVPRRCPVAVTSSQGVCYTRGGLGHPAPWLMSTTFCEFPRWAWPWALGRAHAGMSARRRAVA